MQDKPMRFLGVIISLLLCGCAVMDTDVSVQASGEAVLQSDDEGARNLAAIRALFPERRKPTPPAPDSSDKRSSESDAPPWPPDWLSGYLSPKQSSDQESNLLPLYVPSSSSSLSKPRAVPPDVTVKIPRAITPSPRSSETAPTSGIPAYTVPAPIGSAFPGSSRCVPDLLGGQRCHAN